MTIPFFASEAKLDSKMTSHHSIVSPTFFHFFSCFHLFVLRDSRKPKGFYSFLLLI